MNSIKIILFLLIPISILILLSSCANRKSPSGGEKDTKGPEIVLSTPENKTINFAGKKLYFEFDEFIKEDKLTQKILISPALDSTFSFKIIKKKLYLTFNKSLKENTTYTLNMGDGITDITENNPGIDLKYIFSTGSFLDSLKITGKVTDLESGKPVPDVLIGLYIATDTITPFNGKPYYISRTNTDGDFVLENLKSDKYFIYAFLDKNRDLKYSGRSENIGFLRDTIKLNTNIANLSIPIQKFDLRNLKLIRSNSEDENAAVEFNKGIKEITIKYLQDSTKKVLYTFNDGQNKLNIFNTLNKVDSLPIQINALDSFDIRLDTTIRILFIKKELTDKKRKKDDNQEDEKRQTFGLTVSPANNNILSTKEIELSSQLPVTTYNIKQIYFYQDSITTFPLDSSEIRWNKNMTAFKILKQQPFGDTIRFKVDYGALLNVQGDTNTLVNSIFLKKKPEKYSIIGGTANIKADSFIVQLINKSSKKVLEIKNKRNFRFDYLEAGTYSLRILVDQNKDGKWDRGNLIEKIEPEKIIFHTIDKKGKPTNEIELRVNYELLDNEIKE